MKVSDKLIKLLRHHEGVRNKPYQCPAKLWTVGVHKMLPNVPLRQHEFDGLISFCFNLGLGCFQRSTIRQALLRGDKEAAMESLVKYCRAGGKILKGLQNRRLDERKLFLGL